MINKNILSSCKDGGYCDKEIYSAYKIFFSTLVSESRLRIINSLRKEKKNVTQLVKELNMSQTSISHDLARLKKCGFVIQESKGKYRYYKLNKKTIQPLMSLIDRHMSQYCIHILKEMKKDERRLDKK